MRFDSVGLFWQDAERVRARSGGTASRPMPPIPETGWRPPTSYPNLSSARCLSLDVETWDPELDDNGPGWGRGKGHIVGFSVGADGGGRWYFPIRHEIEPEMNLDPGHSLAWLRDSLSNPLQPKIGANLIYDIGWLLQEGVPVVGELVDVQFAEALLDERAEVSLETLAQKYLGEGKQAGLIEKWIMDYYAPSKTKWRGDIYRTPPRLAGPYGEGDADLPIRLAPILYKRLVTEGLLDLFRMECDLIPLTVSMRMAGVSVDLKKTEELRDSLEKRGKEEHDKLNKMAGSTVEIGSSDNLAKLFDKFGLRYPRTKPTTRNPKGKPSFVKDFLQKVKHPIAELIVEIRRLEKIRGTFLESYLLNSHVNGKVYCSFHPLRGDEGGTRSGRYSSSHPNLQNIPIRDKELGAKIRGLFIPDTGHPFWRKYDYSQIEYRFLIHYAIGPGSNEARALFNHDADTDYHVMTQKLVQKETGVLLDRRPIKNLNFGMIFGMGEEKLGYSLNLNPKEAKNFMAMYHKGVPFAKPTMKANMDEANRLGIITTILGRRSRFDLWESDDYNDESVGLPYELAIQRYPRVRRAYIHKALNRRLQGSAADLMKVAMWRCWKDGVFAVTGVPRLTVHDELDFSDPGGNNAAFREMKRIMENALPISIPVRADCDIGPDWGHVEPLKP